jgi:uncharacterized protein YndB with AHSA1/START domain
MKGASQGDRGRVRIEMALPAPIEDVYAAWTQPEAMARWLAPMGYADVEADVRVGGRFRVVMIGDSMSIEHTGEYLTVEPPRRLSFTWQSPYTGTESSVVSVTLTADGNSTHLLLLHERLPEDAAESHRGGWVAMLQRLVEEVLTRSKQGSKTQDVPPDPSKHSDPHSR